MIIRDLGDGLILRTARPDDIDPLSAFNADVHAGPPDTGPDIGIGAWTRDLFEQPPPGYRVEDFAVVEETATGAIVSSLNLIGQTWAYAGIPFGAGQVELVGTAPAYRRRGLVRVQMDAVHGWSVDRGHLIQVISGIPWYYRQFGYEYAIVLSGGRSGSAAGLPALIPEADEPYRLRPATDTDVPLLLAASEHARPRYLVTAVRDAAAWRYEISGRRQDNLLRTVYRVIETAGGQGAGYVAHQPNLRAGTLNVIECELLPGVSWTAVMPCVLRDIRRSGEALAAGAGAARFDSFAFSMDSAHPVYDLIPGRIPNPRPPYAWYVRVPDLPAFLRRIAPVLEGRLAASPALGYSGELRLCFYRTGIRLAFQDGRLVTAEDWPEVTYDDSSAAFPDLTFLQLLFGHRSLAELRAAYPDCSARGDEVTLVLSTLFPKLPSLVRNTA